MCRSWITDSRPGLAAKNHTVDKCSYQQIWRVDDYRYLVGAVHSATARQPPTTMYYAERSFDLGPTTLLRLPIMHCAALIIFVVA